MKAAKSAWDSAGCPSVTFDSKKGRCNLSLQSNDSLPKFLPQLLPYNMP
jgi:hypothetical protein